MITWVKYQARYSWGCVSTGYVMDGWWNHLGVIGLVFERVWFLPGCVMDVGWIYHAVSICELF